MILPVAVSIKPVEGTAIALRYNEGVGAAAESAPTFDLEMNVAEMEKCPLSGAAFKLVAPESIPMTPESRSPNHDRIGISKTAFPRRAAAGLAFAVGLLFVIEAGAANVLTNPGFETPGLASWMTFGPNNQSENTPGIAHGGVNFYKVYGAFIGAQNYTGIYQDNLSAPGAIYSADGWAYTLGSDGGGIHGQDATWIEVSFRDASYNALALYRSIVVTSNNLAILGGTNTWFDLRITNQCSFTNASAPILLPGTVTNSAVSLMAPAGTAYVRYQVVFAQGPDNANASMYFDDLTLNQTGGTPPPAIQWNIVWSDEFNGNSPTSGHLKLAMVVQTFAAGATMNWNIIPATRTMPMKAGVRCTLWRGRNPWADSASPPPE